ncbi:hypothetical protein H0X09_01100 [Candidatus Saccharibacteria bacterium]|nr:hypothetical protein [Candidatus Saccharibacteria bacterium]
MTRLSKVFAALLMVPALAFAGTAYAAAEGQIEGGNIYRIKNITKNSELTDPASAAACDTLLYWVRIHNPGPGFLSDVKVKATLPNVTANTHSSTMTVSAVNADPTSTTDTATVNLSSSQSLNYESGSTQLLDANGNVMRTLSDGITQGGVSIGNVGVSLGEKRFVQFKVKVNCPQPVVPKSNFECKTLDVNQIDRTRFDFTARAFAENAVIQSYTFTVKNSGGSMVDTKTVNTSATSAVYNFDRSAAGSYTVSVIVNTNKGSTYASSLCTKHITVKEQPTTPTTPPVVQGKTTEELPNTGAGSLLGLFAGASAAGSAVHYAVRRYIG